MTAVILVPASLDDKTFEEVLDQLVVHSPDEHVTVDARRCTFTTPFGFTGLLALAQTRAEQATKPTLLPPKSADSLAYWARAGFFSHARELYDVQGDVPQLRPAAGCDVLLEVTRVLADESAHDVLKHIQDRALQIFRARLNLGPQITTGLAAAVSAAGGNIGEHAGCDGWVMIQAYHFRREESPRSVAVIAVCDAGLGIRRSLESAGRRLLNGHWSDAVALEAAVVNGVSQHSEPRPGQRLGRIRGYIHLVEGKYSVRSGTARIAISPSWDDDPALLEHLAPFPGVQIQMTIPGVVPA